MGDAGRETVRHTPLHGVHKGMGARLVPFAGWEMPVQYSGILAEHKAVRERVGLFDVSHMGEFLVEGTGAEAFLQRLTSNDVSQLAVGQAQYTVACTETGGIVDDLLVYKRSGERYLVCVNAGRLDEDWDWFSGHHSASDQCSLVNASDDYAQLAIQGPRALEVVQRMTSVNLKEVPTYRFVEGVAAGRQCIIARTGYTGEDGFELFVDSASAEALWSACMEAGEPDGLLPIGLGARDTLRLEMKYCLYGNDITTDTTPLEARLAWITKLDKGDFIGRDALIRQKEEGVPRGLVGFVLKDRGIARHGYPVIVDGDSYGVVTSGAMSPSLGTAIGLCYLPRGRTRAGNSFEVEIRGRLIPAEVVKTPFFKRAGN
ncbi:MAG TPA: glycine cleavage system aminomethyltransferase GcvT [Deltaproteobacteria bacterium]|nr:glycine cleavage system protein T [Deltaproteobacteria bacterium]HCP44613.1 glycine cleavage system aminomethyltransferase GcvT [Deltaproteobacteria bacterium]